jgi:hypothetical protein
MSGKAFIDHFAGLEDPRQAWKVVYPLPEILLGVICATLGRAEDCVEIARWGQRKRDFLSRLLPFDPGIASHDTLNDVMNALPASLFAECFTSWVESLRESAPDIVAIDGKTSRRSRAKGSAASGLGLGEPAAAGARAGGGGGEVERDQCYLAPTPTARTGRRARHHRRHGLPGRHRQGDPRCGPRRPARARDADLLCLPGDCHWIKLRTNKSA